MVGRAARRGFHSGQPVARGGADRADGAVAVPADVAPVRQSALSAGRGDPRVRLRPTAEAASARRARGADARRQAERIDRDAAWKAKRAALESVYLVERSAGRELAYAAYRDREGRSLDDFATWCALAEEYGSDWHQLARGTAASGSPAVAEFAAEHADAVDFHRWLQWQLDDQLTAAQATAVQAGMELGIMHDLAVGVDPNGADAWALQDVLALGVTAGAPPDEFNQLGQDWSQPPWRPDQLVEPAYEPFRALVNAVLRHAGGVRIDHIIGLFRLWWIPKGAPPTEGTYVRYDHEAMIGIVALEAHRAGAVVVGEDLGTVEPWVRDYLRERGLFGTSILWFELDRDGDGGPLPAERWREYCLSSVTTHDLPPTAGYLAGEHVRLREELGLLTRSADEELAGDQRPTGGLAGRAAPGRAAGRRHPASTRSCWRCIAIWAAPRRGCWRCRWPTRSARCAPRTSRAPPTNTRTGGCRWAAPTATNCCSKTCSRTRVRPRSPRRCEQSCNPPV